MAKVGALEEPLLADDVETGRKEPTAEEAEELRKEGQMSWKDLMVFFTDPSHWLVTILVSYALFCTLGMCYLFFMKGNFDIDHNIGMVTFLGVAGLAAAAYNAFLAEQLKEEVNRFWRNNQKLKSNKARLERTCQTLNQNVGEMRNEVSRFETLRDKMRAFAETQGEGFTAIFERATGVLDRMKENLQGTLCNLLNGYLMKFEFRDGAEGVSEEEFNNFKTRLPEEFKGTSFADVVDETKPEEIPVASNQKLQDLIDRACVSLAGNSNNNSNNRATSFQGNAAASSSSTGA